MQAIIVRCSAIVGLLVAQGCIPARFGQGPGANSADWPRTLAQAESAALERRFADADRLLANFATQHPGSQGAVESAYWRGLFALDPANQDGSTQVAIALFETYSKSPDALPHRLEADILRRLALKIQSLSGSTVASTAPSGTIATSTSPTPADLKTRDAEIQRLKDELAKANDELDRIKKRLTAPTKP